MPLRQLFKKFANDETGIVSTEVLVMVAAGGLLSVAVMVLATSGVKQLDEDRAYQLQAQEKVTTF